MSDDTKVVEDTTQSPADECDDIIRDINEEFSIVHSKIIDQIDELVNSLPEDITDAPGTVSTSIIKIQSDLTKLRTKLSCEAKVLAAYHTRYNELAKRRKLEIKSNIQNQPTGKMTIKEVVEAKYNKETNLDERDFIATRHQYIQSCIKELDETRELLRTISIQWHSATKRKKEDHEDNT